MGNGRRIGTVLRGEFMRLVDHVGRLGRRMSQFEKERMALQAQVAIMDEKLRKLTLKPGEN